MKKMLLALAALAGSSPAFGQDASRSLGDLLADGYRVIGTEVVSADLIFAGTGPNVLMLTLTNDASIGICVVDVAVAGDAAKVSDIATCTTSE